jgi:hypothetical protein
MRIVIAVALSCLTMLLSYTASASVSLGTLSGHDVVTFSYEPGEVDLDYHFTLNSASTFKVFQSGLSLGSPFKSTMTVAPAPFDPTPPNVPPQSVLDLAFAALASLNAQIATATKLLQTALQNGDDVAAQFQTIAIKDLTEQRQFIIETAKDLLSAPINLPGPLLAAADSPAVFETAQELDLILGIGSYSLHLSGLAPGAGGGSLTFEVTPIIAEAVPEPSTWAMMLIGLAGLGIVARRSRRGGGTLDRSGRGAG